MLLWAREDKNIDKNNDHSKTMMMMMLIMHAVQRCDGIPAVAEQQGWGQCGVGGGSHLSRSAPSPHPPATA